MIVRFLLDVKEDCGWHQTITRLLRQADEWWTRMNCRTVRPFDSDTFTHSFDLCGLLGFRFWRCDHCNAGRNRWIDDRPTHDVGLTRSRLDWVVTAPFRLFLSSFRAVSEQFQSSFRAVSEQFQSWLVFFKFVDEVKSLFRASSEHFQSNVRAVSEQFQCSCRAISELVFWLVFANDVKSYFGAISEQFWSSFRAVS